MATTVSLKPNAVEISGSTSGTTTLQATAVAGTTTLTLPAATDTLVGKATTDTLTNKTLTGAAMNGTVGATTPSTGAFTTLSATGVTTVQAGTAAAPAITTTGDTNTGIWFPAADTIAFTEGGVESMRIDSSGNLLVGTTTAVSGSNHIVVGSNGIQGIKKDFTNLGTTAQSFGFDATNGGVLIGNMKSIGGASVAFILSAVYNNSTIDIYTTTLGNCTAGGNAGTISGINGDARTYTFTRNSGDGLLYVAASSTATGTTTIYLTPLNQYA